MDWPTVLSLAGLFAVGFGYITRQLNAFDDRMSKRVDRLDDSVSKRMDRIEGKIDQLTERYITHLEHHPGRR